MPYPGCASRPVSHRSTPIMFKHLSDPVKGFMFFGIAFGLTLLVSLLAPVLGDALMIVHTLTPVVATLIMLFVVTRDGYSASSWRALGLHRAGLRLWGLALIGPAAIVSVVYGAAWSIGLGHAFMPAGYTPTSVVLESLAQVAIASVFALCEEIGFRGYMLSRLMPLGTTRA